SHNHDDDADTSHRIERVRAVLAAASSEVERPSGDIARGKARAPVLRKMRSRPRRVIQRSFLGKSAPMIQKIGRKIPMRNNTQCPFLIEMTPRVMIRTK